MTVQLVSLIAKDLYSRQLQSPHSPSYFHRHNLPTFQEYAVKQIK